MKECHPDNHKWQIIRESIRLRRKTKTNDLRVSKEPQTEDLPSSPARIPAAQRHSHVRYASRPTCIYTMVHSLLSALFLAAARPSVRSRTSRSIEGFTQMYDPIHARKIAARASGRKVICSTTCAATLEISKCIWALSSGGVKSSNFESYRRFRSL